MENLRMDFFIIWTKEVVLVVIQTSLESSINQAQMNLKKRGFNSIALSFHKDSSFHLTVDLIVGFQFHFSFKEIQSYFSFHLQSPLVDCFVISFQTYYSFKVEVIKMA
jgi:hypothetical protein